MLPPAVSAISVDGKRALSALFVKVRRQSLQLVESLFTTQRFLAVRKPSTTDESLVWTVAFDVSKGTYIRSIARDLGQSLGTEAHISGLRRTFSWSKVTLGSCALLEELEQSPAQVLEA